MSDKRYRLMRLLAVCIRVWLAATAASLVSAQDEEDTPFDFWLSETHVRRLADENTILFKMRLSMNHRTSKVHTLKDDCEIHIAAGGAEDLAWPAGMVVEPPNLCKLRAPGMPQGSETKLRNEIWPQYLDSHIMGKECEVVGFPRIFTEHAAGNTDPANPNHVLEIHPALGFRCGDFELNLRSFLKVFPGMRQIKPQTAAQCVEWRRLFVRKREARYEFQERGGGSCGNFALFEVMINPAWVRAISGGHSAIARVSPEGRGPYTLKLYTYEGTKEDALVEDIAQGRDPGRRIYLHGLFTYDYFSMVKTLRDRQGNWHEPQDWTEVKFPLAFVVLGETTVDEGDQ